ncbi:MAG: tRNA 2-selenouridine synthase [Oleiphilaceae bacterium]|jgi:tRNA 2-selenouridine synthase
MLMTTRSNSTDYLSLFLNDTPLMDVRAPIEAVKGSFPSSINHPLLDNEQRHEIGIRYKQQGEQAAIQLGLALATPEIRSQRYKQWISFCEQNPEGYLFCFRGGLRSRTTQQWLKEQGYHYPLVTGGYKAMRRFLIDELDNNIKALNVVSITGPTGSGKTRVLQKIRHHVDFEGLAQHRGSAFGRNPQDTQPSNIDWENAVSVSFLKHRHNFLNAPLFVEDEGKLIGRVSMQKNLEIMCKSNPLVLLEESMEQRISMTKEDYIDNLWPAYQKAYTVDTEHHFTEYVLGSLSRIKKRLGGSRYKEMNSCFTSALTHFFSTGDSNQFSDGIHILLRDYYDPMYAYQRSEREGKIIFKGNQKEVIEWANNTKNITKKNT